MNKSIIILLFINIAYSVDESKEYLIEIMTGNGYKMVMDKDYKYVVNHVGDGRKTKPCPNEPCERTCSIKPEIVEMFILAMKEKGMFGITQEALDDKHDKGIEIADGGAFTFIIKIPKYSANLSKSGLEGYAREIPENKALQIAKDAVPMIDAFVKMLFDLASKK